MTLIPTKATSRMVMATMARVMIMMAISDGNNNSSNGNKSNGNAGNGSDSGSNDGNGKDGDGDGNDGDQRW